MFQQNKNHFSKLSWIVQGHAIQWEYNKLDRPHIKENVQTRSEKIIKVLCYWALSEETRQLLSCCGWKLNKYNLSFLFDWTPHVPVGKTFHVKSFSRQVHALIVVFIEFGRWLLIYYLGTCFRR